MYGLIGPGLFGLDFSFLARVSVVFPRSQVVPIKSILSSLARKIDAHVSLLSRPDRDIFGENNSMPYLDIERNNQLR